ncbi:MAG: TolC family protein [Litorilituus sp.]|nr:TolC family protein [Litorilituus sp.]
MKKFNYLTALSMLSLSIITTSSHALEQTLSFSQVINSAKKNDPWLEGSHYKQQSLEALSVAQNTQPDPRISIAFANLPTDTFSLSQEGMSQFKVGFSQMFARGDTLSIRNKQLQLASQQQPLQRQDRENKVTVSAGSLWLDLFKVQESIELIEQNRNLFEQLSQLAEASYVSGLGKTRQHDIVRAQLELTRLEDKLVQLKLEQNRYQAMLSQWLSDYSQKKYPTALNDNNKVIDNIRVSAQLPWLSLTNKVLVYDNKELNANKLALQFVNHPAVQAIDKKVATQAMAIELAEQKYKVQWGVNASYGFRNDDVMGNNRADLLSLGLVFDLPLFTDNKQDYEVKSAIAKTQVIKTEKLLLLRQLMSAFVSAKGQLLTVNERQTLYTEKLLPQIYDQAQASLTAYNNNDGDFSDVVRARIAQLNAQLDYLAMNVQEQKIILEINYLIVGATVPSKRGVAL